MGTWVYDIDCCVWDLRVSEGRIAGMKREWRDVAEWRGAPARRRNRLHRPRLRRREPPVHGGPALDVRAGRGIVRRQMRARQRHRPVRRRRLRFRAHPQDGRRRRRHRVAVGREPVRGAARLTDIPARPSRLPAVGAPFPHPFRMHDGTVPRLHASHTRPSTRQSRRP